MLKINVFDVGQASSCLLDFGEGRLGIFDCGVGDSGRNPLVESLRKRFEDDPDNVNIVFLMLSHLDWDHINGIADLVEHDFLRERIRRLYCNGVEFRLLFELVRKCTRPGSGVTNNQGTLRSLRSLGALNSLIKDPPSDDFHFEFVAPSGSAPNIYPVDLDLGLGSDFAVRLLAPSQSLRNRCVVDLEKLLKLDGTSPLDVLGNLAGRRVNWNSSSAVLLLEYSGRKIFLGGDADIHTWKEIARRIGRGRSLGSDVTVAWHHGGRLGRSKGKAYDDLAWRIVLGEPGHEESNLVLISHGSGNRYGHPHKETIDTVCKFRADVLCTQLKERYRHEEREYSEAFASSGGVFDFGLPGDLEIYLADGYRCAGDIGVEVRQTGSVRVWCSGPRKLGGRPAPGCCLE